MAHALTSDPTSGCADCDLVAAYQDGRCFHHTTDPTFARLLLAITRRRAAADRIALDKVIAMFAEPRTHGERVTLAQLQQKRAALDGQRS